MVIRIKQPSEQNFMDRENKVDLIGVRHRPPLLMCYDAILCNQWENFNIILILQQ